MYKFEVYRNPYNPFASSSYNDTARYAESLYVFEREINPIYNDLSFNWSKDKDRYFFRKNLDGSFTLKDADFDWVNNIRTDVNELSMYRILYIKERVDGAWVTQWTGFFSVSNGEFNLSKCSAEFKNLLTFDKYSVILENIETEINIADIPHIAVSYETNTYAFEKKVTNEVSYSLVFDEFGNCDSSYIPTQPQVSDLFLNDDTEKWTLFNVVRSYGDVIYDADTDLYRWEIHTKREYRRDITYATTNPDSAVWVSLGTEITGAYNKYARHYKGMNELSFTITTNPKKHFIVTRTNDYGGGTYDVYCTFVDGIWNVILPDDLTYENDRGVLFEYMVYYLLNNISSISTYSSKFFQNAINPITGETNRLNVLMMFQISDMKSKSDDATIGMFSFSDIENWLKMFQCGWYITDDNVFTIEHRKFFDLGLSYNENSIGLDISNDLKVKDIKTISYVDDIPQTETITFENSSSEDFVGLPIVYYGNIVNRVENISTKQYNINGLSVDLTYVTSNPNVIGNDGFFMAACYIDGFGQINVLTTIGEITESTIWNGDLSVANIQENYWKWGRSIKYGVMNNELTEFNEKNNIIQTDLIVSNCGSFDPYKLVKTSYSDGKVEEANITLRDKQLTLSLSYGA